MKEESGENLEKIELSAGFIASPLKALHPASWKRFVLYFHMFVSFEFLGLHVFSKCLILCRIFLSVGQVMCPHNPDQTNLR